MYESVTPGFLIAMPSLNDPNFERAVVLLCAHGVEGSFGLVVNRPLELPMRSVCQGAGITWNGSEADPVFRGGPVDRRRGWLLHSDQLEFSNSQNVSPGLAITTSQEGLAAFGQQPAGRFRLLLGYAGWSPGQLEAEISAGAWLTAPADPQLIFELPAERMWTAAMQSIGADPLRLVEPPRYIN